MIYIEKSKLNIADMWLIPLDPAKYCSKKPYDYFMSTFRKDILRAYNNEDFVVQLPRGKVISDYKWISVWCRDFAVSI